MLTQTKESPENTRCDASPAARRAQARVAALRSIQQHCRGLVRAARIRAIRRQLAARGSVLAVLPERTVETVRGATYVDYLERC